MSGQRRLSTARSADWSWSVNGYAGKEVSDSHEVQMMIDSGPRISVGLYYKADEARALAAALVEAADACDRARAEAAGNAEVAP